jgi:hypothetical protein
MKTLMFAVVILLGLVRAEAANFRLDGKLNWEITEPRLTFKLDGNLVDLTPGASGTIKLGLWMTSTPYPAVGKLIGEVSLGQISGGYQFTTFAIPTTSTVPNLSGTYYFTVTVMEYTTKGWANRMIVPGTTAVLIAGHFRDQVKWIVPTKTVIAPPAKFQGGDVVSTHLMATSLLNALPVASQTSTTLQFQSTSLVAVSGPDGKKSPKFTYTIVKPKFNGALVTAGQLTLQYPAAAGSPKFAEVITLFYQSASSGTYQSTRTVGQVSETTWGTFNY